MKIQNKALVALGDLLPSLDVHSEVLLDPAKEDAAELHQTVWAEPQLFLLPFCVPQDKAADRARSVEICETVKVGNIYKERSFRVIPDPKYGLPGPFELLVMLGIYRLAAEQMITVNNKPQVPEYIDLGSFRSFLALLGKQVSGQYTSMLKEALKRLTATHCVSEGFFYSKPRDLFLIESFSFLVKAEIYGETRDSDGNRYERTRVKLHEVIRENLNANFRTLVDVDFVHGLKTDLAKSISFHLFYRFYKNAKSVWEPDYDWLANRVAVKVYDDKRMQKRQFKPALDELVESGLLESWEWLPNGKLRFEAGQLYQTHHKKRVQAKDRWLEHQDNLPKQLQLLPTAMMRELTRPEFDPLVPLCAKFAASGWPTVQAEATTRSLTRSQLIDEALKRDMKLHKLCYDTM